MESSLVLTRFPRPRKQFKILGRVVHEALELRVLRPFNDPVRHLGMWQ